jgi:hypothetical protein
MNRQARIGAVVLILGATALIDGTVLPSRDPAPPLPFRPYHEEEVRAAIDEKKQVVLVVKANWNMTSSIPPFVLNTNHRLRKLAHRKGILFLEHDASYDSTNLDLSRLGVPDSGGLPIVVWNGSGTIPILVDDLTVKGIAKLAAHLSR